MLPRGFAAWRDHAGGEQGGTPVGDDPHMTDPDRPAAIGHAVERLVELALADDTLRPGLEALARAILAGLERRSAAADFALEIAAAIVPLADEQVLGLIGADADAPAPLAEANEAPGAPAAPAGADGVAVLPAELDRVGEPDAAILPPRRASRESVPMDRSTFLSLVEGAMREIQASERGSVVGALFSGAEVEAMAALDQPVARAAAGDDVDAVLPGIVTRARLRAVVARDVAEHWRSGRPMDDQHVHRARSEGAAVWMTDLLSPDPDAVTTFAECLDAVADCCEMVVLLGRYEPADRLRRAEAVKDLAAVQSALRIATLALRQTSDDDQAAAFAWANAVTKNERIFVDRHMRLDDPLDPAHLADIMEPVHLGLASLKERADRDASVRKRYQQLTYLVRQLREGRSSARDAEKLVEAVDALVAAGLPPSSLRLRDALVPVAARLPGVVGRSTGYGRVVAEVHLHLERTGRAAAERDLARMEAGVPADAVDAIDSPSAAVRVAREHLARVVIPESAIAAIAEIDGMPASVAWGRSTWRALRALCAYAYAAEEHAGFWEWCESSGHPFAWPANPRNLAMYESDTVLRLYRADRLFGVDPAVSASGEIEMLAHCKIAEHGGRLTPRLYFHDDTKGVTGNVHVGLIGPHYLVRGTTT